MLSPESCRLIVLLLFGLTTTTSATSTWDLAVTIGHGIELFSRNGTLIDNGVEQAKGLAGLAYDNTTRTMYLSNVSIYSIDLNIEDAKLHAVLNNHDGSLIKAIVFDTVSRTLFWPDLKAHVIKKMHIPLNAPPGEPQVLHNLTGQQPQGISLDLCNRHIYWTNRGSSRSIERSNLDGTEKTVIIDTDLVNPVSVAVDHTTAKLYWIDDDSSINFEIWRANLDGSERELLVPGRNQQPLQLAVDRDAVYWTDGFAIWTVKKEKVVGADPTHFKFYDRNYRDARPKGITTRDNMENVDCAAMHRLEEERRMKAVAASETERSYLNLTTSTEETDSTTQEQEPQCLNDGQFNKMDSTCHCKPGFEGANCGRSLCQNYCISGTCVINARGLAQCECDSGYSGNRCEKNVCDGYCLNDGHCSVKSGKPFCTCENSRGSRCEYTRDIDEICSVFCMEGQSTLESIGTSFCGCSETNQTMEERVEYSDNFGTTILLPILMALIGLLTVVVAVLSYQVNKLRRRPRIKKRFVVSKSGVTPLTSRPQIPGDQCEITIENCCNMNICETPCFEPQLRSAPTKNNNTKREEKSSLLDSMEGVDSC